jgi:hypothetical protein
MQLWSQTHFTSNGGYTSCEASAKLGIKPPSFVCRATYVTEAWIYLGIVPPNKYGAGGGDNWVNKVAIFHSGCLPVKK